ncbi:MAG: alkaline phosphatase family protein [Phycisphaeraceae bacterium]|nr:MAG: alkaline phosphatase family protein [Phycisphaeraceae bacterium]
MAHSTAFIIVVGLTESLLAHAPRLRAFASAGTLRTLRPPLPAVTCTVQASMFTGLPPSGHGVVANGWFNRELQEIHFWKQSNRLVQGEKVWETAKKRDPSFTCANMFCWFNMYSSVDWSVTPRPIYKADGRKIPDCYAEPPELRDTLQAELGRFPLFNFWGPGSSIASSRWIAEATKRVVERHDPTLTLVYLPHLDYDLQKLGPGHPDIPKAVGEIDEVAGGLIDHLAVRNRRIIIASEYAIEPVSEAVFPNRALREAGALRVRTEDGHELLDPGASRAFAVADHQVAHVYIRDPADIPEFQRLFASLPGVEQILTRAEQEEIDIAHERSGELLLVAEPGRLFAYDYWRAGEDSMAPDFARTVDIHRKPGYDPRELFIDPRFRFPKLAIAHRLLRRKLGMRTLLDVIPLDASLVKGSHGRRDSAPSEKPILITPAGADTSTDFPAEGVRDVLLESLFQE